MWKVTIEYDDDMHHWCISGLQNADPVQAADMSLALCVGMMGLMENRGMLEERADSIEKAQALLDIAGRGTEWHRKNGNRRNGNTPKPIITCAKTMTFVRFVAKKAQKEWGCFARNVKRATGKASKNGMKAYRRNAKSKRYKKTPCVKKPSMIHGERLGFVHIAAAFVKTKVL
jgi:hypothetical protein